MSYTGNFDTFSTFFQNYGLNYDKLESEKKQIIINKKLLPEKTANYKIPETKTESLFKKISSKSLFEKMWNSKKYLNFADKALIFLSTLFKMKITISKRIFDQLVSTNSKVCFYVYIFLIYSGARRKFVELTGLMKYGFARSSLFFAYKKLLKSKLIKTINKNDSWYTNFTFVKLTYKNWKTKKEQYYYLKNEEVWRLSLISSLKFIPKFLFLTYKSKKVSKNKYEVNTNNKVLINNKFLNLSKNQGYVFFKSVVAVLGIDVISSDLQAFEYVREYDLNSHSFKCFRWLVMRI
ncbi:MAGa4850 family ICE element protein [Mycoplasmopsis fermentans]|uniref:MAGa4850 family ICE element protein n=1 Tax=Mycoplasmopsis fermentans TaxID=2115 RepID=UPI0001E32EA6|nr:hypothetical protein [Mycoplasmopsis fermentans]ADN69094.1 hypothetical membrane spanning protein [Mycoplasmopsis fermentans JER]